MQGGGYTSSAHELTTMIATMMVLSDVLMHDIIFGEAGNKTRDRNEISRHQSARSMRANSVIL